jgi:hypothetical protein
VRRIAGIIGLVAKFRTNWPLTAKVTISRKADGSFLDSPCVNLILQLRRG